MSVNMREELDNSRADDVAYLIAVHQLGMSFYGTKRDLCRELKTVSAARNSNSCWSEGYLPATLSSITPQLQKRGVTWTRDGSKYMISMDVLTAQPVEEQIPDTACTACFLPVVRDGPDDGPAPPAHVRIAEILGRTPPPPAEEVPPPRVMLKGETTVALRVRGQRTIRVTGTISDITKIAIGLAFAP